MAETETEVTGTAETETGVTETTEQTTEETTEQTTEQTTEETTMETTEGPTARTEGIFLPDTSVTATATAMGVKMRSPARTVRESPGSTWVVSPRHLT